MDFVPPSPYLKYSFNSILDISYRSRFRALDPKMPNASLLFGFHTFGVRRPQGPEPQIQDINGTSNIKIQNTQQKTCKLSRKFIQWYFEYLSQVRTQSPGSVSGSGHRITDFYYSIISMFLVEGWEKQYTLSHTSIVGAAYSTFSFYLKNRKNTSNLAGKIIKDLLFHHIYYGHSLKEIGLFNIFSLILSCLGQLPASRIYIRSRRD